MHDPIIVRNVILPGTVGLSDLLLVDERITAIGPRMAGDGIEEFDALGLTALPGGVDSMMHIGGSGGAREPADDMGSGTAAAVLGGTTAILAVVPAAVDRAGSFDAALARARTSALIDYGLMIEVPRFDGTLVADLEELGSRDAFAGIVIALDAMPQTIPTSARSSPLPLGPAFPSPSALRGAAAAPPSASACSRSPSSRASQTRPSTSHRLRLSLPRSRSMPRR